MEINFCRRKRIIRIFDIIINGSIYTVFIFVIICGSLAFSQEIKREVNEVIEESVTASLMNNQKEKEIHQIAKSRSYPGGQDQEPLRVQMQLLPTHRKMSPIKDAFEEADSGAHSED